MREQGHIGPTSADRPVMLLTRAWPSRTAAAGFDRWQRTRHIPEIMSSGLLTQAEYFTAAEGDIPPGWIVPGLRMAVYHAARFSDLSEWMTSPGLSSALSDGERWFGSFHRLDGAPFTGNIYRSPEDPDTAVRRPSGTAVVVDRWEPTPGAVTAEPATSGYLAALRELPGVRSAAHWTASPAQPPVTYYRCLGAELIWTEFGSPAQLRDTLASDSYRAAAALFEEATRDAVYMVHEAYEHAFTVAAS